MTRWQGTSLLVGFVAAGTALVVAQQKPKPVPALAGITAKDPFPNGCVSCHVVLPDGKDVRLNAALKMIKHPNVIGNVKKVPTDCGMCHKSGSSKGVEKLIHKMHYGKKDKSTFVLEFGGQCLSCHSLDPATGKMSIKTGAKNW